MCCTTCRRTTCSNRADTHAHAVAQLGICWCTTSFTKSSTPVKCGIFATNCVSCRVRTTRVCTRTWWTITCAYAADQLAVWLDGSAVPPPEGGWTVRQTIEHALGSERRSISAL